MSGYTIIKLDDMLQQIREDEINKILSSFKCSLNLDIEEFLHRKAILFSKQGIAKTHLVMASYQQELQIAGYFSLANKCFVVKAKSRVAISNSLKKRIAKFGIYDSQLKQYTIVAPLIGQIGKNENYNTLIKGDELLYLACSEVRKAQEIVGGKVVYLECEDVPELKNFYDRNGFVEFGKRELDSDECSKFKKSYLIQMLKYLHDR